MHHAELVFFDSVMIHIGCEISVNYDRLDNKEVQNERNLRKLESRLMKSGTVQVGSPGAQPHKPSPRFWWLYRSLKESAIESLQNHM